MEATLNILVAGLVSWLWQLVMHWIPWRAAMGQHVSAKPLVAYGLGVLGIVAGFTAGAVGLATLRWFEAVGLLMWCALASGVATVIAYAVDWALAQHHAHRTRQAMDAGVSSTGGTL